MWTPNILPIVWCLQTATAIPFVTNIYTGISYQGTSADEVEEFQNIRFAEDTSGANRFAPPVPYLPSYRSTIDATASGAACPQASEPIAIYPFMSTLENLSEDCLNLRIARPADRVLEKPLPVMVWIHGGGYHFSDIYDQVYNPVGLVQESVASGHPVIFVATNYRVGMFGFAVSEALHDAKSENVGLRDQKVALQWVKDNIAAFGGDPDNITVFGQSAGSISAGLQMVAFRGEQGVVFQKAIMDSGAITGDFSTGFIFNNTAGVAKSLNCSGSDMDSAATLACLRSVPLETLLPAALATAKTAAPPEGIGAFRPVIDGDFIPDQPSKLVLEGSFVKGISVIGAWTTDDGTSFLPPFVNSSAAVSAFYGRSFSQPTLDQLLSLYPVEDFEAYVLEHDNFTAQFYRAARIFRDTHMTCPTINLTGEISLQSHTQTYLFALNSTRLQPVWDSINQSELQIAHSSDVPYFFNVAVLGADNNASAMQLSAEVSRSFSAFATSGDPSTPVFDWPVAWSEASGDNATIYVIGGPYGAGPAKSAEKFSTCDQRFEAPAQQRLGAKKSSTDDQRSDALAREKLAERCAFINTIIE